MHKTMKAIKINLNNLDKITQNSLMFFFNSGLCDKAELHSENCNVHIIDRDREFDKNIISDLKYNNHFAIVLHNDQTSPMQVENVYSVIKPVKPEHLKQQIGFIEARLKENVNDSVVISNTSKLNNSEKINVAKTTINKTLLSAHTNKPNNNHLSIAVKKSTQTDSSNQYKAHKHVGSNKDINPENPEEIKNIYHTPKKYLYHHLAKAIKLGRGKRSDVRIKTIFGSVLYEYKSENIYHQYAPTKIKYFKSSPLFESTNIVLININSSVKKIKNITENADVFLWESAILASKGKIPQGTSLNQVVEMIAWPNYSRLLVFRYMIQISAAWSTNHLSLIETSKQLNIPQRYIFTLYNAMLALGSAKINNVINNDRELNVKKGRSVFSKILSHIFNK